jgi:hypothetical protein
VPTCREPDSPGFAPTKNDREAVPGDTLAHRGENFTVNYADVGGVERR